MTDDIYVGFFASRCADITYNNVKVSKVGEAVEAGEMTIGGNGFNGNDDPSSANYASIYNKVDKTSDTAFKVYVDTASAGKAIGKLSNSEDSYTYYASEISKDDDFVMTGKMKLGMGKNFNPKEQGGSGIIVFDSKYRKDATGVATDVASGVTDGNSVMAGAMVPDKTEAMAYLCTRVSNDKSNKAKFDATPIGTNQQDYDGEVTYTLNLTIHHPIDIRSLEVSTVVFYTAIIEYIASYLRTPFDLLLPGFHLGLFGHAVLKFLIIQNGT